MSLTYPLPITSDQRTTLSGLVNAVSTTESLLLAQIAAVLATNAQNGANSYTDGQISAVNSTLNTATGNIAAITANYPT